MGFGDILWHCRIEPDHPAIVVAFASFLNGERFRFGNGNTKAMFDFLCRDLPKLALSLEGLHKKLPASRFGETIILIAETTSKGFVQKEKIVLPRRQEEMFSRKIIILEFSLVRVAEATSRFR